MQFIDSIRFMANSSLNIGNKHSEGIHIIECKFGHDDKKCETYGIKCKDSYCFLEYTKNYQNKVDEMLEE